MLNVVKHLEEKVNFILEKYRPTLMERDNTEIWISKEDFDQLLIIFGFKMGERRCVYFQSSYGRKIIRSKV